MVYASMLAACWWASTVMMLESSPPDRKLDTGTSATRCALTDSWMTDFRSAAGLPAPAAATSRTCQYCLTSSAPPGLILAQGRDDRLELGGEDDAVAALEVEERLNAERVAGEHQLAGRHVGDGEREH